MLSCGLCVLLAYLACLALLHEGFGAQSLAPRVSRRLRPKYIHRLHATCMPCSCGRTEPFNLRILVGILCTRSRLCLAELCLHQSMLRLNFSFQRGFPKKNLRQVQRSTSKLQVCRGAQDYDRRWLCVDGQTGAQAAMRRRHS